MLTNYWIRVGFFGSVIISMQQHWLGTLGTATAKDLNVITIYVNVYVIKLHSICLKCNWRCSELTNLYECFWMYLIIKRAVPCDCHVSYMKNSSRNNVRTLNVGCFYSRNIEYWSRYFLQTWVFGIPSFKGCCNPQVKTHESESWARETK